MAGKETQSVLRKMASPRAGTGPMRTVPVARLIRRAFETAAQEKMGIPLEVKAVRQSSVRLEDVRDLLGSYGFLVLLEGRPAAALAVEMPLLSGIVEQQTIGTVLSGAGGDRAATKVDAALFAPLVDDALRRFSISLEAKDKDIWGRNYAFGAMTADPRTLVLSLAEGVFHLFELDLVLAGGARTGRMAVVFPDRVDPVPVPRGEDDDAEEKESLRNGVLAAPASMDAVLTRITLSLSELQSLSVGQVIPLVLGSLKNARLEIGQGVNGIPATLGQLDGLRAVRLNGGAEKGKDDGKASKDRAKPAPPPPVEVLEEKDLADAPEVHVDPMIEPVEAPEQGAMEDSPSAMEGLDDLDDLLEGFDPLPDIDDLALPA